MLNSYIIGLIRTWVPIAIGAGLTWLLHHFQIILSNQDSTGFTLGAVAIVTGVYYGLAHWAELWYPQVGRWLLAFGLTRAQPTYSTIR